PVGPRDRQRAVHLAEHSPHAHALALPEARRELPRGCRRARGRPRAAQRTRRGLVRTPAPKKVRDLGARIAGAADRPREWGAGADPASRRGLALSWWRTYRGIDGPLQSLLLTIYVFLAVVPAVLVLAEYLQRDPSALADHLVRRYHLRGAAASNLRDVLEAHKRHHLATA